VNKKEEEVVRGIQSEAKVTHPQEDNEQEEETEKEKKRRVSIMHSVDILVRSRRSVG
jgi:hypothetical protein